ncbi:MAG TPA: long-chain fatty acid--CoA ligase [Candidatus Binatia bacterium]|nr:long-chain fatty acid--CoA ligase [Candidatus Binatia bacterium]
MNIFDALQRAKTYLPKKEALTFKGKATSYLELYEQACRLSAGLSQRFNLQRGDRVAVFLPNIPEFIVSYYASQRIGAIAASLNVMLKRDEVEFILNDCGAKVLITAPQCLEQIPPPKAVPALECTVCVGESDKAKLLRFSDLLSGSSTSSGPVANLRADDPAAILYTSGTTGKPKGVLLSHGNLVSNVHATNHHTRMSPEDRLICYLPLFHCFGQNFIMNASVNSGATLILHERFVPDEILQSVQSNRVTMFFGVPTIYLRYLAVPNIEPYFDTVRYFFSAAAPMPVEVARRWAERFGRIIYEGYGLTETSPFASYNHDFTYREGSVGTPIENVEMKIVDERGNDLPPGEIGEIVIKGPNIMQGYYQCTEETAQAVRDGWFFTGDIGRMDDDGYFYLVDRAKDMINVSGFKVWPREVEEVLMQHSAVGEVAVIGVRHPDSGEAVKGFVVLKGTATIKEQDLIDFCRSRMAVYKAPRFVEFIDALPRNPSGKILKRELRIRQTRVL